MKVVLGFSDRKENLKRVVLQNDAVIGRGQDCNLRIASRAVSRRHCQIRLTDDEVLVTDLNSSTGTIVNGHRLDPDVEYAIEPDSELRVGPLMFHVGFRVDRQPAGDQDDPGSTARADVPGSAALDQPTVVGNEFDETIDGPDISLPTAPAAVTSDKSGLVGDFSASSVFNDAMEDEDIFDEATGHFDQLSFEHALAIADVEPATEIEQARIDQTDGTPDDVIMEADSPVESGAVIDAPVADAVNLEIEAVNAEIETVTDCSAGMAADVTDRKDEFDDFLRNLRE